MRNTRVVEIAAGRGWSAPSALYGERSFNLLFQYSKRCCGSLIA